jgi:hypothetical protein
MWSIVAVVIWFLGTWKFYPFGLGVLLLPVLRLRRGWIVLATYSAASAAFMAYYWGAFTKSSSTYAGFVVLGDFPAVGRLPITARMIVEGSFLHGATLSNLLVGGLAIVAVCWGVVMGRRMGTVAEPLAYEAMLASAGAVIFLGTVFVAGFGFAYKVVFLLLMLPLIAQAQRIGSPFLLYSALVSTILVLIPSLIGYSILLTSLASIIAASIGLGASVVILLRQVRPHSALLSASLAQNA